MNFCRCLCPLYNVYGYCAWFNDIKIKIMILSENAIASIAHCHLFFTVQQSLKREEESGAPDRQPWHRELPHQCKKIYQIISFLISSKVGLPMQNAISVDMILNNLVAPRRTLCLVKQW